MQPVDNDIRTKVLITEGNIAISASAGTGKTYLTVKKIIKDFEQSRSFRTFAAITFTRKAAKEISIRLGSHQNDGFVGTNDNFVLSEIIQPFMHDVYGREFKKELKPDYSRGNAIQSYRDGISKLQETGIIHKYSDVKKNFSFQLALDILINSKIARRYFKSKYYRIYIDEYQDSDVDMHNLFMYLCVNMGINIFVVGDVKQSIYGWRGGYCDGFKMLLNDSKFNAFTLKHNFRSNLAIQNYSNIFIDDVRGNCQKNNSFNNEVTSYKFNNNEDCVKYIKKWIDIEKRCSFLLRSNNTSEIWSKLLCDYGLNFMFIPSSPLDNSELESEHVWIARVLANFLLQDRYTEYDVLSELPLPESHSFVNIKKLLKKIKETSEESISFLNACIQFYEYLSYQKNGKMNNEINKLFEIMHDVKYKATYNSHRYNHIVSTIHSSKGLEYDQVIILANDYNLSNQDDSYLHYVAVSRPKDRLLVVVNDAEFRGTKYLSHLEEVLKKTVALGIDIEQCKLIQRLKPKSK